MKLGSKKYIAILNQNFYIFYISMQIIKKNYISCFLRCHNKQFKANILRY